MTLMMMMIGGGHGAASVDDDGSTMTGRIMLISARFGRGPGWQFAGKIVP